MPLTYSASGRVRLPDECMGLNPHEVSGATIAGVDVRENSWDIIIGQGIFGPNGQRIAKPVFVGKVRDEDEVLFCLKQYRTRLGIIDCRPEATLAKRLQETCKRIGITIYRCEYNTAPSAIEMSLNQAEMLLKLDKTMTLDKVQFAFQSGINVVLPQNYGALTCGQFSREMKSMVRVPKTWMGKECYMWESSGPDHAMNAMNYFMIGLELGSVYALTSMSLAAPTSGYSTNRPPPQVKSIVTSTVLGAPKTSSPPPFDDYENEQDAGEIGFT